MSNLQSTHFELLKIRLQDDFTPHLPAILDDKKPYDQQVVKNLSRAFSAFTISQLCDTTLEIAASSVVDDFDDKGIDAIYYHPYNETLYLVQSKLKTSEMFKQEEALLFCQGVRKLLKEDFDGFNQHVQKRKIEIEDAINACKSVELVISHIGGGISANAYSAISDLFENKSSIDDRLIEPLTEFDSQSVIQALMDAKAHEQIDVNLKLRNCTSVDVPRITYFGLVPLIELVSLHKKFEKALYEKNIRTFLGQRTDVNAAIRNTLSQRPENFLYLHNGVAALCQEINPKNIKGNEKKLDIKGISIINGAQTIASAAQFVAENTESDISSAQVLITLIQSSYDSEFGKDVTRARNHQNSVASYNFAALDDKQEQLRRELSYLGYNYIYKAGIFDTNTDSNYLHINEAALALALFTADPRFTVTLKREPAILLNTDLDQYKTIFSDISAQQLINAVYFFKYIQERISAEVRSASNSQDRLIYKHGLFVIGWILAHRVLQQQKGHYIVSESKIRSLLSQPFDELREIFLEESKKKLIEKGPLAFFKSQSDVLPLLETVTTKYYGLVDDVALRRNPQLPNQPYPVDLFKYIIRKAPQISDLT